MRGETPDYENLKYKILFILNNKIGFDTRKKVFKELPPLLNVQERQFYHLITIHKDERRAIYPLQLNTIKQYLISIIGDIDELKDLEN